MMMVTLMLCSVVVVVVARVLDDVPDDDNDDGDDDDGDLDNGHDRIRVAAARLCPDISDKVAQENINMVRTMAMMRLLLLLMMVPRMWLVFVTRLRIWCRCGSCTD